MELNPYESPRVLEPLQEQEPADINSVRQLLVEIRDGQRELLQLQREALKAQTTLKRFGSLRMLVPFVMFALFFAYSYYIRTTLVRPPPTPARPAPRAVPPTLVPPAASLSQPDIR